MAQDADSPFQVLLIEDSPADVYLFQDALGDPEDWEVVSVPNLDRGKELASGEFDVLVLDLGLPGSQGPATLDRVLGWKLGLPVVVLTGSMDAELGSQLIQAGAEDFISKGELESRQLRRVLEHAIARHVARPQPMGAMAVGRLEVIEGEEVVQELTFGARGARIGRSPDNHLHVDDAKLSRRHALVWVEGRTAWVEDLGSTNGTDVNGQRIAGPVELGPDDKVELGGALEVRVTALGRPQVSNPPSGEGSLPVGTGPAPGDSGLRLSVGRPEPTLDEDGVFPYSVDVSLSGTLGCRARIDGPGGRYTIDSTSRVALIWALADRVISDREAGVPVGEAGWLTNWDVSVAVWGRKQAINQSRSALSVLLHRVRRELEDAGLDPEMLEKRRGGLRLAVREVTLHQ